MRPRSRTLPFPGLSVDTVLFNMGGMVRRISVRESTGSAGANFTLFDGTNTTGVQADPISLLAGQSTRDYYRWDEYPIENGLFFHAISGKVDLTIVITPADLIEGWGEPVIIIGEVDVNIS